MIRKFKPGQYRLFPQEEPFDRQAAHLGTFSMVEKAKQHEGEMQYLKKH
jgi:hypothetical protein